jgi:predicted alpha/beta superfamily hydrolase
MTDWHNFSDTVAYQPSVIGRLLVWQQAYSPQLDNQRDIFVHLPPSYHDGSDRHYPVVYMHDGQNLFDENSSFVGEWQVDESMTVLANEGIEAIIVGISSLDATRMNELGPFTTSRYGESRADLYLSFLTETIKPVIDADFRTLPDRTNTVIMGSSMGGLVSFYALYQCPDTFGKAGIMSPAFRVFLGDSIELVKRNQAPLARIYLDAGTHETMNTMRGMWLKRRYYSRAYRNTVRDIRALLLEKCHYGENLRYVEDRGAIHHEKEWSRRFPDAMRFLLPAK